jgi:uncharacterized Rmd1/YagE family protein
MDCFAFCSAASYRIKPLYDSLRGRFKTTLYRDVVHIEIPNHDEVSDVFFFSYGVTVGWGLSKVQLIKMMEEVRGFEHQRHEEMETDEFTFRYGDIHKIVEDAITLPNHEVVTKLAISQGLAQSVKLGTFEIALQRTFNSTKLIPDDLAKFGRIPLSRKEIRRKMGELFIERSSINLHVDVLDTPEFFWEYPELEPLYKMTSNYLDVTTRVEILNKRLDVVHELFEMLGNELNHQHSNRLEMIIIILIVCEVMLTLLHDIFNIL